MDHVIQVNKTMPGDTLNKKPSIVLTGGFAYAAIGYIGYRLTRGVVKTVKFIKSS